MDSKANTGKVSGIPFQGGLLTVIISAMNSEFGGVCATKYDADG